MHNEEQLRQIGIHIPGALDRCDELLVDLGRDNIVLIFAKDINPVFRATSLSKVTWIRLPGLDSLHENVERILPRVRDEHGR